VIKRIATIVITIAKYSLIIKSNDDIYPLTVAEIADAQRDQIPRGITIFK